MLDILEYLYFGLVLHYHGRLYGFLKSRIISFCNIYMLNGGIGSFLMLVIKGNQVVLCSVGKYIIMYGKAIVILFGR
jgi:hypothetical protein